MNKKRYMAALSCAVLAVAMGVSIAGTGNEKETVPEAAQNYQQEEKNTEMVDANKNYGGVNYSSKDENGEVKVYPENKTEVKTEDNKPVKTETEKENKPSAEIYTDDEEFVLNDSDETVSVFMWPVKGEIVMDYSTDSLVYDATLEQYRTNDSICIAAEKGKEVICAADGTVESVERDSENGYTVTVFHGDGWRTTYGQLDESTAVKQGDILKAGEKIGEVSDPSKYSVALGHHLEFSISENNNMVDPKTKLE